MNNKNKGRKFEEKFIKTLNSGAFRNDADAKSQNHCLEIKYTDKKSFRISIKLLKKIWEQAFDNNRFPMFGIGIKEDENTIWMLKIDIVKQIK